MSQSPIAATQQWVTDFVVGLNLCPFAQGPLQQGAIRWVLIEEDDPEQIAEKLLTEVGHLIESPRQEVETTLVVLPNSYADFEDFWQYLGAIEELIKEVGAEGHVQAVGFHPGFRFAGETEDDPAAFTNRSPYPMVHLLREESVEEVRLRHPEVHQIPKRNQALLRQLGAAHIRETYLKG